MADNQALGELAAQDRYDPIVPAPDVLPRSTQVLGGLADLGGVDPVVLPQNPNPLADNPFSHYVAQKLYGLGQGVVDAATLPGDVYAGRTDPTSEEGGERAFNLAQMMTGTPRAETGLGSGITGPLFHGSPRTDLTMLKESNRGPLGPGVYASPSEQIAGSYAGPSGKLYELPDVNRDVYRGLGHRTDDEWAGFKNDKERLLAAADPDKREALSGIMDKMWSADGYPAYQRIRQLYGGDEQAQGLFRKAGFHGISGLVDGPEVLLFGNQPLTQGIRAYHGSPYDFDRFDMSKIGTGEGAQAYGHGLYFAGNEDVARVYRDNLAVAPKANSFNWNPDGTPNRAGQVASELDARIPEHEIRGGLSVLEPHSSPAQIDEWISKGRDLYGEAQKAGHMYEVNINAHPDQFLDYDKPLNQQGDYITSRLGSSGNTGAQYQELMTRGQKGNQIDFANMASNVGIPGIKYLDQGSRGSGTGTSNYVVFNDKLIDILRKYGLAGLTAGAGATAAGQQMDNSAPFGMIGAVPVAGGAMGSLARQDDYQ